MPGSTGNQGRDRSDSAKIGESPATWYSVWYKFKLNEIFRNENIQHHQIGVPSWIRRTSPHWVLVLHYDIVHMCSLLLLLLLPQSNITQIVPIHSSSSLLRQLILNYLGEEERGRQAQEAGWWQGWRRLRIGWTHWQTNNTIIMVQAAMWSQCVNVSAFFFGFYQLNYVLAIIYLSFKVKYLSFHRWLI